MEEIKFVRTKYGKKGNKQQMYLYKCHCGNYFEANKNNIKSGQTKSCGCLNLKRQKERLTTHGLRYSKIYPIFHSMRSRCNNINNRSYKDYGGRGIKCKWNNFEDFYKDMGGIYKEGLQIDRIDNNGNYCKENCKWVTRIENASHKRNTKYIIYNGERRRIKEVCEELGFSYKLALERYNKGLNVEKVFARYNLHTKKLLEF